MPTTSHTREPSIMNTLYGESVDELNQIAAGWTSSVYRIPLEHQVVKVLDKEHGTAARKERLYNVELAAYRRMSLRADRPNSILKFYGSHPTIDYGILLELAEQGNLYDYLHKVHRSETPPEPSVVLRWAEQLSEALKFVHSNDIIHCDIHTANCFLDEDLNLKLGDFGACSIDGERPAMMYRPSHQLWLWDEEIRKWKRPFSINSEIFAVGCTMYFMETGRDAFGNLDRTDKAVLTHKLQKKEMPSLDELPILGRFIEKCWKLQYSSTADVFLDIRADSQRVRL